MGYTLAAALKRLGAGAAVTVAELLPAVVAWNRGPLAHLAHHPLEDGRVRVREGDIARILRAERAEFDAILLDVDNGPKGLVREANNWLYSEEGLSAAFAALRPEGILAVWSAGPDRSFHMRLRKTGFEAEENRIHVQVKRCQVRDTIWIAKRPA
jgi:spermidine synthase